MSSPLTTRVLVWDWPVRLFHAGLIAAFAGAYLVGESERYRTVHVALGYAALALIGFRLLWGLVGSRFARFSSFAYSPRAALRYLVDLVRGRVTHYTGHNPAGSWAVYALLILGVTTGVTGWMRYEEIGGERLEELHEVCANAWLGLVILHIVAVGISSVLHRENLPRAMLTGYKAGRADEAIPRAHGLIGIGLAVAIAALVYGAARPTAVGAESAPVAGHAGPSVPATMAGRRRIDDD